MNLPSLYVLADEYRAAVEHLADLDLPAEVVADTLEGLAGELEAKATNVAMFAKNLEAMAEQIKTAEADMARRRKSIENRAAHIRQYLKDNMIRAGISKIECQFFKLAIRDNPPFVVIDAESQLPAEFIRTPEPPPPAPDKAAIKAAILAGQEVPGAHLDRGQRIEIK